MVENTNDEIIRSIRVLNVIDQDDGSALVEFEVDDEFRDWFKKREGLKRWSRRRFEKFVIKGLWLYLDETENEKQIHQGLMAELADATDLKSVEG